MDLMYFPGDSMEEFQVQPAQGVQVLRVIKEFNLLKTKNPTAVAFYYPWQWSSISDEHLKAVASGTGIPWCALYVRPNGGVIVAYKNEEDFQFYLRREAVYAVEMGLEV